MALIRLLMGNWIAAGIHVVARLGVADCFADAPLTAAEIAADVGAEPDALHRLLRMLAGVGVFSEGEDGRFELTPMAACLCSDHPASVRAVAELAGGEQYAAWGALLQTIQTGEPAFEHQHGVTLWSYLERHPQAASLFDAAMAGGTATTHAAIVEAFDFSRFGEIVDVGGGVGALAVEIANATPSVRIEVFDRPAVADGARTFLAESGVSERCSFTGGDFFERVPTGADAYILCAVLHDWDSERAAKILANCRAAMAPHAVLLIVESLLPAAPGFHLGKLLDLNMLVMHGGRERREDEYRALLTDAGFELLANRATRSSARILECRAALQPRPEAGVEPASTRV